MSTRVSAVIVLHRSRALLEPLLDSLRRQTRACSEWIFCLNGEDDGAEDYLRGLPEAPTLILRPDNPGFAGGANAGIAAASGDYILFLNPDVVLADDYVELLLAVLVEHPEAGAAGGLLWREDSGGRAVVDSAGFSSQPWLRIVDRDAGRALDAWTGEVGPVLGVCGAAFLARVGSLEAIAEEGQVFDEVFWMYKEDQDLCLRLKGAGFPILFEPTARARHGRGWAPGARAEVAPKLRLHSLKNRYILLAKHFRARHVWRLPLILGFELLLGLRLLVSEPGTLRAYGMARRHWKAAREQGRAFARREREKTW